MQAGRKYFNNGESTESLSFFLGSNANVILLGSNANVILFSREIKETPHVSQF